MCTSSHMPWTRLRRPNFEYRRKLHGYVRGWRREWWQGSTGELAARHASFAACTLLTMHARHWMQTTEAPQRPLEGL